LLARCRIPFVVDYDDAIYHRYELNSNQLVRALLGRKIDVIMARANVVIVGNQYLEGRARAASARRVEQVPTVVDLERYKISVPDEHTFTVGWIGSPSTVPYLSTLGPVLTDFCRARNARLVLVGARGAAVDGLATEARPWSEETEVKDILDFDVGIMPLPD